VQVAFLGLSKMNKALLTTSNCKRKKLSPRWDCRFVSVAKKIGQNSVKIFDGNSKMLFTIFKNKK